MAAVQPIRKQSYEQIYDLLRTAILTRSCLSARYRGYLRLCCPYMLGLSKSNLPHVLVYQYGGESASGLGPVGSAKNWRCICIEKLTDVKLTSDPWIPGPKPERAQSCIATIQFASDTVGRSMASAE